MEAIRNYNSNSGYSSYLLNTGHMYRTVTHKMDIIRTHKKGKYLNALKITVYIKSVKMTQTVINITQYPEHRRK
jgi:cytidylate kinase